MANTKFLKDVIEPEIREKFIKKYRLTQIHRRRILGIEPDIIAYKGNCLYLGEITSSGYLGSKDNAYHIGGARKVAEIFMKFSIIKNNLNEINIELNSKYKEIKCYYIYPTGAKYSENISGYSLEAFNLGIMEKCNIDLEEESLKKLIDVLNNSRDEMK